ncbi:MAG: hypothetical protein QF460_00030 [Candidatus Nanoarchaeia archaeon]|jgi:hypothetical protein|nr:hypothetical protein [Candidatus Nanoarchaeia archaeon]
MKLTKFVKDTSSRQPIVGTVLTLLLVFIFANIGYLTGFPLIIFSYINYGAWWIVNLLIGLIPGAIGIPDFMFEYSKIITKYGWGFILNGWFVWWFINKIKESSTSRTETLMVFPKIIFDFALLWIVFSFAFTSFYTGYVPFYTEYSGETLPITGCLMQEKIQSQVAFIQPQSCDIPGIEARILRSEEKAAFSVSSKSGTVGKFAEWIDSGNGLVFKSKDVTDENVVNSDAGSTLTDLRAPKRSYSSSNLIAEDIKILANIEAKNLFLDKPSDSKIKVFISPNISKSQCAEVGRSNLIDEINSPFYALDPNSPGEQITFVKEVSDEDNEIIIDDWCIQPWECNIDGISTEDRIAQNTFNLGSGFHQQIKCIRPGLSLNKDVFVDGNDVKYDGLGRPFYVDVDFSYEGVAAANKQLFIIDKNVARQEEDPITALDLQEFIISNSYNDGRVTLGIGTDNLYEFVTPTYDEDFSSDVLELGLSFSANRYPGGYKAEVNKVTLWVQVIDDAIDFVCGSEGLPQRNDETNNEWKVIDPCEEGERSGNFYYEGPPDETESYHKFVMDASNAEELRSRTELKVGEFANYHIDMFIPSEVLGGASYQGILIESEVEYTYTTRDDLLVRVTHDEFVED